MRNTVLEVESLAKKYRLGTAMVPYVTLRETITNNLFRRYADKPRSAFWAVKDVSFSVAEGEVVGLIGGNGAGKSTLLKMLSRITEPTVGHIRAAGKIGALLEVGTGFHPELTGRENVFLSGSILGMDRNEITKSFDEILDFAGVEDFIDTPVKRYSSGMLVRLGFAVAAHFQPDILLVDEVLAVGDAKFQKKCIQRMGEVSQSGKTILFVSHNMSAISNLCSRCLLLENGQLSYDGDVQTAIKKYLESGTAENATMQFQEDPAKSIQIVELSIKNKNLKNTLTLDWNEPATLSVKVKSSLEKDFVCKVQLYSGEGVRLSQTISANAFEGYTKLKSGSYGEFNVTCPAGLLNQGAFQFSVLLVEGNSGLLDHRKSPIFWVEPLSASNNFLGDRKRDLSLLRLPMEWHFDA